MKIDTYAISSDNQLIKGSEIHEFITNVIDVFKSFNYDNHIKLLSKQDQKTKRNLVKLFQNELRDQLDEIAEVKGWMQEERINQKLKDSYDLSFKVKLGSLNYQVIIELDASRGDQIAKKFVLRTSHTLEVRLPTIYFAFCYPGTESMSESDFKKILSCCQKITSSLYTDSIPRYFIGITAKSD